MNKVDGSVETSENRELGCSEEHAALSDINISDLDDALEMKPISIRMQTSMIDDLKMIAKINGLGYQPLMKQVLGRFVEAEKKKILRERAFATDSKNVMTEGV